jgi:hypothetical protein
MYCFLRKPDLQFLLLQVKWIVIVRSGVVVCIPLSYSACPTFEFIPQNDCPQSFDEFPQSSLRSDRTFP